MYDYNAGNEKKIKTNVKLHVIFKIRIKTLLQNKILIISTCKLYVTQNKRPIGLDGDLSTIAFRLTCQSLIFAFLASFLNLKSYSILFSLLFCFYYLMIEEH